MPSFRARSPCVLPAHLMASSVVMAEIIAPAMLLVNSPRYPFLRNPYGMTIDIGKRVKGLRNALGLTQKQLAQKVGISQPSIANIEGGRTEELRGPTLAGLCKALNTNQDYLLTGKGDPGPIAIVTIDHKELLDIWSALDDLSRDSLLTSARALLDRQDKGKPSAANPFPKAKKIHGQ